MRYRPLLETVLAGSRSPACPVAMWKHHPVADQQAASLAAATIDFQLRFDFDFVKITPASTYQLRDYGLRDAWRNDPIGRRTVETEVITRPDDWRRLPYLDPRTGFAERFLTCATLVRQSLPRHVPVLMTVFNPLFQAATLASWDRLRRHIAECPDAVSAGLAIIGENTRRLIESLVQAGVDGIYFAVQQAQSAVMDDTQYRKLALKEDFDCLEVAGRLPLNMLHLHGTAIHAGLFTDLDVAALHYDADDDNPSPGDILAADYRGVSTGPSASDMASNGAIAVLLEKIALNRAACGDSRFILSAGCALPLSTPADRIDAVVRAARHPHSICGRFAAAGHA